MDRLTKQEEKGIWKLLHYIHNEEVTQYILETLGKENWTRAILSECDYLTNEQEKILESFGGLYSDEELDKIIETHIINIGISKKLKEQGVTHYLYENEDYLDEIREGKIICEGIDVEKIKNTIHG